MLKYEPRVFKAKVGQTLLMGFLMATTFSGIDYITDAGYVDQSGMFDMVGALFFVCVNQTMMNMMGVVTVFCDERPVFLREQANKMYGVLPYFMSKALIDMPAIIIMPFVLTLMIYFAIGLAATFSQFFSFYGIMLLIVLSATSIGYFLGSLFPQPETAVVVSPVCMMPIIIFGGLMVNVDDIYPWLAWIQWLSPIRYGMEALMRNEFSDVDLTIYNPQTQQP